MLRLTTIRTTTTPLTRRISSCLLLRQRQHALLLSTVAPRGNDCFHDVVQNGASFSKPITAYHQNCTKTGLWRDQLQQQQQKQQQHRPFHTSLVRCAEENQADDEKEKRKPEAAAESPKEESEEPKKEVPPPPAAAVAAAASEATTTANKETPAAEAEAATDKEAPPSDESSTQQQQQQQQTPPSPSPSEQQPKQYSTPELTQDAAAHRAGLNDPDVPDWQNPLWHQNPATERIYREDFDSPEEFEAAVLPAPPLQTDPSSDKPQTPAYLEAMADEIVNLTVLEMNELINKMADHFGFHEGMLSPDDDDGDLEMGGAQGADDDDEGGAAAAPVQEKTTFDVKLTGFDAKSKIKVIKEVRAIAGLGLKEAKELVEGAPATIQKEIKKEQAEEIKAKLEEVGATVEIV